MQLKIIASNVLIKSISITNAAMAVLSLRNEGTVLSSNGDLSFKDIDNKYFQSTCSSLLGKNNYDHLDFRNLINCWSWDCIVENNNITKLNFLFANKIMDENSEDIILLKAIAPYVESGSYILFAREDFNTAKGSDNFMRIDFNLGRVHIAECVSMSFSDAITTSSYYCYNNINTIITGTNPKWVNSVFNLTKLNKIIPQPKANKPVYGGNCKKCKLYDDYAIQDSFGNILCYKCNVKN